MFKKILLFAFLFVCTSACASENIFVEALEDYSSVKPAETFRVKVLKPLHTDHYSLLEGDILVCSLYKTKKPKRAKRDAQVFFFLKSYIDINGEHPIDKKFLARYSKTILNFDTIKSIPPKTVIKKTASSVTNSLRVFLMVFLLLTV